MGGVDVDEGGGFGFVLFELGGWWGTAVMRRLAEGFTGLRESSLSFWWRR